MNEATFERWLSLGVEIEEKQETRLRLCLEGLNAINDPVRVEVKLPGGPYVQICVHRVGTLYRSDYFFNSPNRLYIRVSLNGCPVIVRHVDSEKMIELLSNPDFVKLILPSELKVTPEQVAAMSMEQVEQGLRELGLDPEKPLPDGLRELVNEDI